MTVVDNTKLTKGFCNHNNLTSNYGTLAETVVTMVNVCKRRSVPQGIVKLKLL